MTSTSTFVTKLLFLLLFCGLIHDVYGQGLTSWKATARGGVATTMSTDYHALGVNPANLGIRKSFRDPTLTFGFLETNLSFFADKVKFGEVYNSFVAGTFLKPNQNYQFDFERKRKAVEEISNKPLSVSINATIFGAHFSSEKFGGIGFSVRDKLDFYSKTNPVISSIMFLGHNSPYFNKLYLVTGESIENTDNLSAQIREQVVKGERTNPQSYGEVMDGSSIQMIWSREYNVAYGRQIYDSYNVQLFGGVGIRYLQGISYINLEAKDGEFINDKLSLSPSFSLGFDVKDNPTAQSADPKQGFGKYAFPKPIGNGFGLDAGINMLIKRKLYIGASLVNYGTMNWTGNVFSLSTDKILAQINGTGFDNFNLTQFSTSTFQLGGEGAALNFEGSDKITQKLPTMLRLGVSYDFFKRAHVGFDVVMPQNTAAGNIENNLYALGADIHINRLFTISTGLSTGGNQGGNVNIPVGVTYLSPRRHFEIGFATQDLSSFIADIEGGGKNISFAFSSLRFRF